MKKVLILLIFMSVFAVGCASIQSPTVSFRSVKSIDTPLPAKENLFKLLKYYFSNAKEVPPFYDATGGLIVLKYKSSISIKEDWTDRLTVYPVRYDIICECKDRKISFYFENITFEQLPSGYSYDANGLSSYVDKNKAYSENLSAQIKNKIEEEFSSKITAIKTSIAE